MDLPNMLADAVLSNSADAIVAADRDGIILFWNPGAERIFGYAAGDAIGQSLDIIIPERQRERHWDGYRRVMDGGQSRYGHGDILAVPALRNDGSRISVEFTVTALKDGAGTLTGLVAILRDVSQRFEEMRSLRQKAAGTQAGP